MSRVGFFLPPLSSTIPLIQSSALLLFIVNCRLPHPQTRRRRHRTRSGSGIVHGSRSRHDEVSFPLAQPYRPHSLSKENPYGGGRGTAGGQEYGEDEMIPEDILDEFGMFGEEGFDEEGFLDALLQRGMSGF